MKAKEDFYFFGSSSDYTLAVMTSLMNMPSIWKYHTTWLLNIRFFITYNGSLNSGKAFFNGVLGICESFGKTEKRDLQGNKKHDGVPAYATCSAYMSRWKPILNKCLSCNKNMRKLSLKNYEKCSN
jgi:hypothetical protein